MVPKHLKHTSTDAASIVGIRMPLCKHVARSSWARALVERIYFLAFAPDAWINQGHTPPGTKLIHAGNTSRGINFCTSTCGACIRTRANTGNIFDELFLKYVFAPSPSPSVWIRRLHSHTPDANTYIFVGYSFRSKYVRHMESHLGEHRKRFLANYLCNWFRRARSTIIDTEIKAKRNNMISELITI